jgi:hypothetical protein
VVAGATLWAAGLLYFGARGPGWLRTALAVGFPVVTALALAARRRRRRTLAGRHALGEPRRRRGDGARRAQLRISHRDGLRAALGNAPLRCQPARFGGSHRRVLGGQGDRAHDGELRLRRRGLPRKERSESYSALAGFFRQYELVYVVGDERELIGVRTTHRRPQEDVYVYRVPASRQRIHRVFHDYVRAMNEMRGRPRFYNTLQTNCTTGILMHARVNPDAVPFSWKVLLSGYLPASCTSSDASTRGCRLRSWSDGRG